MSEAELLEQGEVVKGFLLDLLERAPGPIVRTEDELHAVLRDSSLEEQTLKYAAARERFTAGFGEYDKGTAARDVVDQFFSEWRRT